jgi:serine/threonine protein kinase
MGGDAGSLPDQFGKYSLLGHLATGGMAEVYLARQGGLQGFEKIVVIKRVRPEMLADHHTTQLFLDEARLVATLEHPNIAPVYEIGIVGDAYFFVMEYVHGADLRQVMEAAHRRDRKITLADAVYIMIGVCAALHYAHEKCDLEGRPLDIIHRDVSPSNVLISHDGAVKVCDFGIAKASNRTSDTQRGVLKGKFAYMSPEQCRSEEIDHRSDIFAMGILLYELTTLSRLFDAASDYELLKTITEKPVPPPSVRVPGYPPELERIVMRALQADRDDRYSTAQEMQLELEAFAREHKLAMSSVSIKHLMASLFEKRMEAWNRSLASGKPLGDHLLETVRRPSGALPVFMPLGSEEYDVTVEPTPGRARRSQPIAIPVTPAAEAPKRRASALWLVCAILAGAIAGGVTALDAYQRDADRKAAVKELDNDAERIGATLDGALRSLQMRAQTIAGTPVLRTAIETDAATVADLAKNEYVFAPGAGETIEVFTLSNGTPASAVRMPADASPIKPGKPQETRFEVTKSGLVAIASTPIAGGKGVSGMLAIGKAIDLSVLRQTLAKHTPHAALAGLASELALVPGEPAASMKIAVPLSSEWGTSPLVLAAAPPASAQIAWIVPVRYAACGAAALFLLLYVVGLRRARG